MNFLTIIRKGAAGALSSYKHVLVSWSITLALVLVVALPLRSSFSDLFGKSLAVSVLNNGFDAGILGDLSPALGAVLKSATTGGLLLMLTGYLLFTFFAGGFFTRFTTAYGDIRISAFFRASAMHFPAFLLAGMVMTTIIGVWSLITLVIPAAVIISSGAAETGRIVMPAAWVLFIAGLPVLLLVADNSRRWMAATGSHRVFAAIGRGFRVLGNRFMLSYSAVLAVCLANIVVTSLTMWLVMSSVPSQPFQVFLFFLATQVLFILRIMMKTWRWATVSELALAGRK